MSDLKPPRLLVTFNSRSHIVDTPDWESHISCEYGDTHGLLVVKANAAEMISQYVGETESNVRNFFKWKKGIKSSAENKEVKAVILSLEAIDVLTTDTHLTHLYARCVTTLLLCLDGLDDTSLLPVAVVARSNKPRELIDARLQRPGRLYKCVEVKD
eukprot:Blabericola_migrator_1__5491@NODE_27_length_20109_cov_273_259006_g24_i0_p9_GENE_NODE_27_length_20109_cov_273_259006_g24_i0NODE_27_length_20109_cov_273_259006_g24_i0_p9_ORF_typecomplete_len157_score46_50AAA/PF00004_29/8_5e09_NODE_27_length_20109_cov_273_259006_g24_i01286313333